MAHFELCPAEIVEDIVTRLDRADVYNLRLCSRALCTLTSQDTFKSLFSRSRRVLVNSTGLEEFVRFADCELVAAGLEEVVIVGEAIDTTALEKILHDKARWFSVEPLSLTEVSRQRRELRPNELREVRQEHHLLQVRRAEQSIADLHGTYTRLLTRAFQRLKQYGRMRAVALDVDVFTEDSTVRKRPVQAGQWKFIWSAAAWTCKLTMAALAQSRLHIYTLDLFNRPARCSLSCRMLNEIDWEDEGLKVSLGNLKSLAISVSERMLTIKGSSDDHKAWEDLFTDEDNFIGMQKLLGIMPSLEQLTLHWYGTEQYPSKTADCQPELFFKHVSESAGLSSVKSCTLQGVYLTESALLKLLRSTQLTRLTVENVTMKSGTFIPIFQNCTSEQNTLSYLDLNQLYDEGGLVFFNRAWTSGRQGDAMTASRTGRAHRLERSGADVRQPIAYSCYTWLRTPQMTSWPRWREKHYGPPQATHSP